MCTNSCYNIASYTHILVLTVSRSDTDHPGASYSGSSKCYKIYCKISRNINYNYFNANYCVHHFNTLYIYLQQIIHQSKDHRLPPDLRLYHE